MYYKIAKCKNVTETREGEEKQKSVIHMHIIFFLSSLSQWVYIENENWQYWWYLISSFVHMWKVNDGSNFLGKRDEFRPPGKLLFEFAANSPQINSITCFYCWQKRSLASIFNFRDKTMLFPCQRDHVRRIVRWSVSADIRGWNFNVLIAIANTRNRWMNRNETFF